MEGLCPLHPHKGHRPLTQSQNWQSVSHKQFPGEAEHHTHIFLPRTNVFLRIGCGTAARRNPFAEVDCFFASWMRHWRPPTGWRCETPPAGCFASGENEKKPAGKGTFLTGFFLHFHCARGHSFRFLQATCGKQFVDQFCSSQKGCRADGPAVGGTGGEEPPAPFPSSNMRKTVCGSVLFFAEWVQG